MKKAISLILALTLVLGLSVTAFATDLPSKTTSDLTRFDVVAENQPEDTEIYLLPVNEATVKESLPDYACEEAMNTLCTNLSFSGENVKKVMVTSCHAAEGKTYISINIMRTLAKLGKTVVLVDADLRRSIISSRYGLEFSEPNCEWGLAHSLLLHGF